MSAVDDYIQQKINDPNTPFGKPKRAFSSPMQRPLNPANAVSTSTKTKSSDPHPFREIKEPSEPSPILEVQYHWIHQQTGERLDNIQLFSDTPLGLRMEAPPSIASSKDIQLSIQCTVAVTHPFTKKVTDKIIFDDVIIDIPPPFFTASRTNEEKWRRIPITLPNSAYKRVLDYANKNAKGELFNVKLSAKIEVSGSSQIQGHELITEVNRIQIGTRALKFWPYPNSIGFLKWHIGIYLQSKISDATNTQPIHEHIFFSNPMQNIGFSGIDEQNEESLKATYLYLFERTEELTQLKQQAGFPDCTLEQLQGIYAERVTNGTQDTEHLRQLIDLEEALQQEIIARLDNGWIKQDGEGQMDFNEVLAAHDLTPMYVDEPLFKEAAYYVVMKNKYQFTKQIEWMNLADIERYNKKKRIDAEDTKNIREVIIPRLEQPKANEAGRYRLLTNNCQGYVSEVKKKYEELFRERYR